MEKPVIIHSIKPFNKEVTHHTLPPYQELPYS